MLSRTLMTGTSCVGEPPEPAPGTAVHLKPGDRPSKVPPLDPGPSRDNLATTRGRAAERVSAPGFARILDGGGCVRSRADSWRRMNGPAFLEEGDALRSDGKALLAVYLPDGSRAWLSSGAEVEFARFHPTPMVTVWAGTVGLWMKAPGDERGYLEAPGVTLELSEALVRVDVTSSAARCSLFFGSCAAAEDGGSRRLVAGTRVLVSRGALPGPGQVMEMMDDFDRLLVSKLAPPEASDAAPGMDVLDGLGEWVDVDGTRCFQPNVGPRWTPFRHGSWTWSRRRGLTWLSKDGFGYPTHHYGKWTSVDGVWTWAPGVEWLPHDCVFRVTGDRIRWAPRTAPIEFVDGLQDGSPSVEEPAREATSRRSRISEGDGERLSPSGRDTLLSDPEQVLATRVRDAQNHSGAGCSQPTSPNNSTFLLPGYHPRPGAIQPCSTPPPPGLASRDAWGASKTWILPSDRERSD